MKKCFLIMIIVTLSTFQVYAQINLIESDGWLESAYIRWLPTSGAEKYHIYYSGEGIIDQKIDNQLIRNYGTYYRADILGLSAGNYSIKVVPVFNGVESASKSVVSQTVTVKNHLRSGFAFTHSSGRVLPGGYNEEGTVKSNAKIIYVTAKNVNTVESDVINDKGVSVPTTGLTNILNSKGKGYDKTPLIIRIIGLINDTDIMGLKDGNFISLTGFNNSSRTLDNITFEGVGEDATLSGYGFSLKRTNNIEIRNVAIMLFGDDAISMDTDNANIWVHHNDFFYGKPGSDADQVKGDGTIDMKYNSSNITISFNHFWDTGKSMGCGGGTETVPTLFLSFHHNWFDHSDSRNPRLHYSSAHIFNNYYDGVSKYSIGNTTESSAFVEANYF